MSKSRIKLILTIIAWTVLIALLVINIKIMTLEVRAGNDYLENVNIALLKVTGGSMEPVFHEGDIILVKQEPYENVEIGDIIVFEGKNELITHTLIEKNGERMLTQGEANAIPDDEITKADYRAKVICKVPFLSGIWRIYSSKGLIVLWALLLVMLLFGKDIFSGLYDLAQRENKKSAQDSCKMSAEATDDMQNITEETVK